MKNVILSSLFITSALAATAQTATDKKAIDQLCGCFEVTFNYAETFTTDTVNEYIAKRLDEKPVVEYVHPIKKTDKEVILQHILVVGERAMIKHWREDWKYENSTFWDYDKDNHWVKRTVNPNSVKGQWTQTVWEVSDAPRYQGSSKWLENNGKIFWLNTTDAPLPRREYTKRSDYNVMNRTNNVQLTSYGYMHEQDNIKILRKDGKDEIIAYEKGYNKYVKVDDSKCEKAKAFWEGKKEFWADVVTQWEGMMKDNNHLTLVDKIEDKLLYEHLDVVEKKNLQGADRTKAIKDVLTRHITVKK